MSTCEIYNSDGPIVVYPAALAKPIHVWMLIWVKIYSARVVKNMGIMQKYTKGTVTLPATLRVCLVSVAYQEVMGNFILCSILQSVLVRGKRCRGLEDMSLDCESSGLWFESRCGTYSLWQDIILLFATLQPGVVNGCRQEENLENSENACAPCS